MRILLSLLLVAGLSRAAEPKCADRWVNYTAASLKFFADQGHPQIIAGYYGGDLSNFQKWDAAACGVLGVRGFMYTTWNHKFGLLEAYGKAIGEAK